MSWILYYKLHSECTIMHFTLINNFLFWRLLAHLCCTVYIPFFQLSSRGFQHIFMIPHLLSNLWEFKKLELSFCFVGEWQSGAFDSSSTRIEALKNITLSITRDWYLNKERYASLLPEDIPPWVFIFWTRYSFTGFYRSLFEDTFRKSQGMFYAITWNFSKI